MEELITYEFVDTGIYKISCKKVGNLGEILLSKKLDMWVFSPIENFLYKPIHIALILRQLNDLNGYKKGNDKH